MKNSSVNHVAAFGKLVEACNNLGASYTPGSESIKPAALDSLLVQAQQSLKAAKDAYAAYTLAMNKRREEFAEISTFAARLVRNATSFKGKEEDVRSLKLLKNRLQTSRKKKPDVPGEKDANGAVEKSRRISHKDFANKAETFADLVRVVSGLETYTPAEEEFSVAGLQARVTQLKATMESVTHSAANYAALRIARDKLLYGNDGLHKTAIAVKDYIRAKHGFRSAVARDIGKIRTTTKKVK